MKSFMTLLSKEFLGLVRSSKVIWLPIVFMLLSVMQPVTYYFMDDILASVSNLPEGFPLPEVTTLDIYTAVIGDFQLIGLLC